MVQMINHMVMKMTVETYTLLESYMLSCMEDSAHDSAHVYRVLYNALEIAETESAVDGDVLIGACLLHDVGRKEQFQDPNVCHAAVGAEKARAFLTAHGFDELYAERVAHCIRTHRYRKQSPPQSIEAKILFDADKLDAAGATGIARTLIYKGIISDPLYTLAPDGSVSDGANDTTPSFFQEYKYKLENIYAHFYTARGAELARERQAAAVAFYESLYDEVSAAYRNGKAALECFGMI